MFSSWPTWRGEEGLFWRVQEEGGGEGVLWDYSQEHLVVIKDERACPFVKLEIILLLLCCLLYHLTNKHCRSWGSMINLWIDFKTFQKNRILLSARKRSSNYLGLSKENVLQNIDHALLESSSWYGFTKFLY